MRPSRVLFCLLSFCAAGRMGAECVGWAGFEPPVRYTSSAVQAVLVRDLNRDGAPEIIASGNHVDEQAAFSLFRNRGDGTFAAESLVPGGFGEELEDVADLDGDGMPDLLVSNYWANGIATYRGNGALGFDAESPYGTATHGGPSFIVDYDRDGVPDVVSLSFGSGNPVRVHLFPGKGGGTLGSKTTFETSLANGASLSSRTIHGVLELLVNERSHNLGLLRYENGAISVSRIAAGPGFDLSSTFADLNGDGVADIVDTEIEDTPIGDDAREPVFVTLANADGTFGERRQLVQSRKLAIPFEVRVADLDGDGHADLVVGDFQKPALYLYRGDGAGYFAEGVPIDAGGPVNTFAIGDVNGDGHPDVVTANADHNVSVVTNR
ncbi:MAG: FG-GAP repeat domain-containing protein, partial [Thermoanaerobaculia bacterium]